MIYLDNAATTKVFDRAIDAAKISMSERFFNPNATYSYSIDANKQIEKDRSAIAKSIGAEPNEIVFTSCATESNNWALSSGRKNPKGNIVISAGEHSSVYECAVSLKNKGVDVRIAPLMKSGVIDKDAFSSLIDKDTTLVSVIHVSNETGVVNPIKELVGIAKTRAPRCIFHSDGVQALLKVNTGLDALGVDLYSASAHKLGAPKGIGLLYIKHGVNIAPYLLGGGQEDKRRSGTQNTPYISAFAAAVQETASRCERDRFISIRNEACAMFEGGDCKIIGSYDNSGYILCVCIPGVKAEILQNVLSDKGIVVGKGAACSGSRRGNRVLSAMGVGDKDIECCLRLSFFVDTKRDDVLAAVDTILAQAKRIRSGHVG